MEYIQFPTSVEFLDGKEPNTGLVSITPCQQGYGATLGNALRRVLLSSLPGAAAESIRIEGVQHEFSAIPGVLEDVIQIILNVKLIAARVHGDEPVTITLSKKGTGDVTIGEFEKNANVEIINPELKILTVTDDAAQINMEITIGKGSGYMPVVEKNTKELPLGTIAIDSLYTPIRDVGYDVELTRVGEVTDYEKLTMTIETNGTITPKDAMSHATKILMDHFALILDAAGGESPAEEETPMPAEEEAVSEDATEAPAEDVAVMASSEEKAGVEEEKPKKRGRKKKTEQAQ